MRTERRCTSPVPMAADLTSFDRQTSGTRDKTPSRQSHKQLSNRLCAFDADKLLIEARVEIREMVRIEAEALQRGRVQVLHVVAIIDAG